MAFFVNGKIVPLRCGRAGAHHFHIQSLPISACGAWKSSAKKTFYGIPGRPGARLTIYNSCASA